MIDIIELILELIILIYWAVQFGEKPEFIPGFMTILISLGIFLMYLAK